MQEQASSEIPLGQALSSHGGAIASCYSVRLMLCATPRVSFLRYGLLLHAAGRRRGRVGGGVGKVRRAGGAARVPHTGAPGPCRFDPAQATVCLDHLHCRRDLDPRSARPTQALAVGLNATICKRTWAGCHARSSARARGSITACSSSATAHVASRSSRTTPWHRCPMLRDRQLRGCCGAAGV